MLSKCANPDCNARFRYLRSGKLFRFDVTTTDPAPSKNPVTGSPRQIPKKPSHRVEHFWLCGECATTMTLKNDKSHGVTVISLKKQHRATA